MPSQTDVLHGPHTEIRIEGDIVFVKTLAQTTLEDLHVIFGAYARVRRKHGRVLALYDGTKGAGMASDARKEIMASANMPDRETNAVATFGAPFAMRALVNMLDRALVALRRKSLGVVMFATEEEARAHLDRERQKLLNRAASTTLHS